MTGKLFVGAIAKFLLGVVLVGALLFLPADYRHHLLPRRGLLFV